MITAPAPEADVVGDGWGAAGGAVVGVEGLGEWSAFSLSMSTAHEGLTDVNASDVSGSRVAESEFIGQFNDLNCDVSTDEDEEIDSAQYRRYMMRRRKRWSLGVHKRTYSQSIEGDSSYSDDDPLDDNDSTARRLRRRVRGPGNRASLHFEDMGFPNMNNIIEIDEPDYAGVMHSQGPPSIPSDDGFTLDELPFWGWQGTAQLMEWEVESDSS